MYPWINDSDFPLVEYTTDDNGDRLVMFRDKSRKTLVVVKADVLLAVAFKMCNEHVETEWATRHLESQGYCVEKHKASSYGRLADWVEFLGQR